MSALAALVPALKRGVAVPGGFGENFPTTTDQDLTEMLADGFAQARLDGFMGKKDLDLDTFSVTPDLAIEERALVTIYATVQMTRTLLLNRPTSTHVVAGAVESQEDYAATVLVQLLQDARAMLARLQERGSWTLTEVSVVDAYRMNDTHGYGPPWAYVGDQYLESGMVSGAWAASGPYGPFNGAQEGW